MNLRFSFILLSCFFAIGSVAIGQEEQTGEILKSLRSTYATLSAYSDSGRVTSSNHDTIPVRRKLIFLRDQEAGLAFFVGGNRVEYICTGGTFFIYDHHRKVKEHDAVGRFVKIVEVESSDTFDFPEDYSEAISQRFCNDILGMLLGPQSDSSKLDDIAFSLHQQSDNQTVLLALPKTGDWRAKWYLETSAQMGTLLKKIELFASKPESEDPLLIWTAGEITIDSQQVEAVLSNEIASLELRRKAANYKVIKQSGAGPTYRGTVLHNPDANSIGTWVLLLLGLK